MKIVLNPQYGILKDFVNNLPDIFSQSGKIIYKARNELRVFEVSGMQVNVKKYKTPVLINRVAYTFFRPSKAERAYHNALQVLEKGFETPTPIAYIEKKTKGLFSESYFISLQCLYAYNFRKFGEVQLAGNEDILTEFARFTARLHESNILHLDYSPGNILFDKTTEGVHFSLLDINRMQFGFVNEDMGCRNFERLWGSEEMFQFMASKYAQERGFNAESCRQKIGRYHKECMKYFRNKEIIKQKIKEKDYKTCFPLWLDNFKYLYFPGN
jgi:serine/threonine protein kinase